MTAVVLVAMVVLALAVLVGLATVARVEDDASKAVVGDLVFFAVVGILLLLGIVRDSSAITTAALLASLVGVLATMALARILTRGRR